MHNDDHNNYAAVGKTTTVNKYFDIYTDVEMGSKIYYMYNFLGRGSTGSLPPPLSIASHLLVT